MFTLDEGPPKRKKKKKHRSTVQELDDDHNKAGICNFFQAHRTIVLSTEYFTLISNVYGEIVNLTSLMHFLR